MIRHRLSAVLASFILFCASLSYGASPPELEAQIESLDREIAELVQLVARIDNLPERDRESLLFRRDQRSFALLASMDEIAQQVNELAEDDPGRQAFIHRLQGDLSGVGNAIIARSRDLGERIAHFEGQAEAAGGGDQAALLAYVASLEAQQFRYQEALTALVEGLHALGLPDEELRRDLIDGLVLQAEVLAGELGFSSLARKELNRRLGQDSGNADLQAALAKAQVGHAVVRQKLEDRTDLLARLDQDVSAYKTILLQHGVGITVDVFEPNVMLRLAKDSWSRVSEAIRENSPDIIFRIFMFFLVLVIFRYLSRLTRRMMEALLERSGQELSTLMKNLLVSVSGGMVMAIGFLMALSQAGVSIGPALAGLGVAGFVVGFALQDTLGNFAAGAMILFYRPYDVDDFVEVAGASGLVKKMSLVSTTIATYDNQTLVVPNSKIWGDVIKNVTAQKLRRVDLEFGIGYGDDLQHAERVLQDIVEQHELILSKPEPLIKVHSLGDSSVNFAVRPWTRTENYWNVYWDLIREVKLRFDREGISIPFPQRDVHLYAEADPKDSGND